MEESAERRERLKAMRIEASEAATSNDAEASPVFHGLSNPLIETPSPGQGQVESSAQRFDYYTDPMAAFSGTKRRSKVSPQISQNYSTPPRMWNPEVTRSPAPQPLNYSPGQQMHPPQGHYGNTVHMVNTNTGFWNGSGDTPNYSLPYNSPRGGNFPSTRAVQGNSTSFNLGQGRGYQFNDSPRPGIGQDGSPSFNSGQGRVYQFSNSPRPGLGHEGSPSFNSGPGRGSRFNNSSFPSSGQDSSPSFNSGQGRGYQFNNNPHPGFGHERSPNFNSEPGRGSRFNNSPVPSSGQGGFYGFSPTHNPELGREQRFSNSPSPGPNSGRGRGRWSGQSGGRGRGSQNHVSAEDRPDLFYSKSMIEDPWKPLKPVIWKTVNAHASGMKTPDSLDSWLSKSIAMKRAKVANVPSQSSSQPSLAEYLAASFNEAADHEPSV